MSLTVTDLDFAVPGKRIRDGQGVVWTKLNSDFWRSAQATLASDGTSNAQLVEEHGPISWDGVQLRERPGDQPLPTASTGPSMHDLAGDVMAERKTLGLKRYGQPLQAMNGRDPVRDTIEELADGLVYALQVREERRLLREELAAFSGQLLPGNRADLLDIIDRYFPEEPST